MDRKTFLGRFGMGVAGIILAPKIITSSIVKEEQKEKLIGSDFKWNSDQIFIRVINNNPAPTEIMLFGANQAIAGNIIPEGIKIMVAGSSFEHLYASIQYEPLRILGLEIRAKQMGQLLNPMHIFDVRPDGRMSKMLFQPINYRRADDVAVDRIQANAFELLLTPSIYIMNEINANEQVDYIFTLAYKNNITSVLRSVI